MPYALLPDMEQELIDWLTAHAGLAALHGGRVATELQSDLTCLQVTSLGGGQPWPWEASPEFQVSSWGGTKARASLLDRTLIAAAYELVGTPVDGGHVSGGAVRLKSLWSPDEETNRPRYRSDLSFLIHPA